MRYLTLIIILLILFPSICLGLVDYSSIASNTWVRIFQGTVGGVAAGTEPPGMILSFGGGTIDPVGKKLMVFGGGHNDYYGNEVWIWNITTQVWTKKYTADSVNSSGNLAYCLANTNPTYPGMWTPNSRPISRHSAHGMVYMTYNNKYFVGGSSLVSGATEQWWQTEPNNCYPQDAIGNVCCPGDIWWYDETANTWAWKAAGVNNHTNVPRYSQDVVYNPSTQNVIIISNFKYSVGQETWTYSPASGTFTKKSPSGSYIMENEQGLAFDTLRGRLLLYGGADTPLNILQAYTEATNTWVNLNATNPPATAGYCSSITYDSLNDRVILYGNGGGKIYNPTTNAWSNMTATGGPDASDDYHYYSRLHYDVSNNLIFAIDRVESSLTVDIWAYRYAGGQPNVPSQVKGVVIQGGTFK